MASSESSTSPIPNHSLPRIMNVIPIETPIVMSGRVIKGFGRGGKLLGIPTANLPAENFEQELSRMEMGVYIGFAKLRNEICKTILKVIFMEKNYKYQFVDLFDIWRNTMDWMN
ncbi:hypothetical protein FDP41_003897 [Naegleria fowleri]|uniref:riboflavin kinase n=1 Tax=Naegleria fowleri TaxID=5763 RepID=A0A6A5BSQ9_NAEFO|nr:uncharacterized protein FDP41_003897 [Naegleria fowleri]KAF0977244.1 hypothetical protein FDP41_003897 [Naegleria fowleri]CAG4710788.1 unnamed protein product [Naegleria fowleri]